MCKFTERGWLGYVIDVVTAGAYTTYRTFEYTECIQKQNIEESYGNRLLKSEIEASNVGKFHKIHLDKAPAVFLSFQDSVDL
jgi:hypothetical protein